MDERNHDSRHDDDLPENDLIRAAGASYQHAGSESQMDAFIANELYKMSLEERQIVFEVIHGVERTAEETPTFLSERLSALEFEVSKIQPKRAYEMAERFSREYVHDAAFRLTFLRADLFHPVKAAERMVLFFECRLYLFGPDLLTRPLTLADLDQDTTTALEGGTFQILPSRDTAGRAVLVNVQGMFKRQYRSSFSLHRAYHYMMSSMVEDMETQHRGIVLVFYQIGKFEYTLTKDAFNDGLRLIFNGSPVRVCGTHMCLDQPLLKAVRRIYLAMNGTDARAKNRLHEGSPTEVQYRLASFGIPVDLFPITSKNELKKTNHMKWLSMRKVLESTRPNHYRLQFASLQDQRSKSLRINLPGRNDVLMGKGKPFQYHAGNVAMRSMVASCLQEYSASERSKKPDFAKKIISNIESKSGHFLRKDPNGFWVLATADEVQEKLIKMFAFELAKAKRSAAAAMQEVDSVYPLDVREEDGTCFSGGLTQPRKKQCHSSATSSLAPR